MDEKESKVKLSFNASFNTIPPTHPTRHQTFPGICVANGIHVGMTMCTTIAHKDESSKADEEVVEVDNKKEEEVGTE